MRNNQPVTSEHYLSADQETDIDYGPQGQHHPVKQGICCHKRLNLRELISPQNIIHTRHLTVLATCGVILEH
jgi:hypothetical protein